MSLNELPYELVLLIFKYDAGDLHLASTRFHSIYRENYAAIIKSTCNQSHLEEIFKQSADLGYTDIIRVMLPFINFFTKETALKAACHMGHYRIVELLINDGADIHTSRDSPLILATEKGHYKIVKLLLYSGADAETHGNYALRLARSKAELLYKSTNRENYEKIVKLLVSSGCE